MTTTTNQPTPIIPDEIAQGLASRDRATRDTARTQLTELNEQSMQRRKIEVQAVEQAKAVADAAQAAEETEKVDARTKGNALREWCRNGGRSRDFEAQWPTIKADILRQKIISAANRPLTVRF